MYHGLCTTARKHGYALAIHGTVTSDLDLVAIPWTPDAAPARTLFKALLGHIGMIESLPAKLLKDGNRAEKKPHGRLAWNLYMAHGAKVDLSVMPRRNSV